jgi:predicted nucleic-acid-binding Zn-ribbon protein
MTAREELWVTCKPCQYSWIVAYLPMEMGKTAVLMSAACCPKCGDKGNIFLAKDAEIIAAQQRARASA